jgi:hypothetical protein
MLFRITLVGLIFALSCLVSGAQTDADANAASTAPQAEATDTEARTSADETFELNIVERRITERDFEASTSVEAGEESARGLRLRVGVGVGAGEINVLLRNVRGRVRFRATLEPVLRLINSRRATTPPP